MPVFPVEIVLGPITPVTHSTGHPVRRLALQGQRLNWLAQCQYTVTGLDSKFDLQLLSRCGSTGTRLIRSVAEYTKLSMLLGSEATNQQEQHHSLQYVAGQ